MRKRERQRTAENIKKPDFGKYGRNVQRDIGIGIQG